MKSDIEDIKINIENLKNKKLEEIYNNLQIIYCWPTIPIYNIYTANIINNELKESIGKYEKELNNTKKKLDEKPINLMKKPINLMKKPINLMKKPINLMK